MNMHRPLLAGIRLLLGLGMLLIAGLLPAAQAQAQWAHDAGMVGRVATIATRQLRVGVQVGHWKASEVPNALARLRLSTGASWNGRPEWALNLDIAQRTAAILRAQGIAVDILPSTIPTGYQADAFVAIHADANGSSRARGYKVATRWRSTTSWRDQILTESLGSTYARVTGLPLDPSVTRGMRGYYAFSTFLGTDYRVDKTTPATIIEMGFMTSAADRALLYDQPDLVASGIAQGILGYLQNAASANVIQARAEAVAAGAPSQRSVVVTSDGVRVRTARDGQGTVIRTVTRGDVFPFADTIWRPPTNYDPGPHSTELANGGWSKIVLPGYTGAAYISRDYINVQQPGEPPAQR